MAKYINLEIENLIKLAAEKINKEVKSLAEYKNANDIADALTVATHDCFREISAFVKSALPNVSAETLFGENDQPANRSQFHHYARPFQDYHPNLDAYASWNYLSLNAGADDRTALIVVLFQGTGEEYHGVIACQAVIVMPKNKQYSLTEKEFQINYKESKEEMQKRFEPWLQNAIKEGIQKWVGTL